MGWHFCLSIHAGPVRPRSCSSSSLFPPSASSRTIAERFPIPSCSGRGAQRRPLLFHTGAEKRFRIAWPDAALHGNLPAPSLYGGTLSNPSEQRTDCQLCPEPLQRTSSLLSSTSSFPICTSRLPVSVTSFVIPKTFSPFLET